MGYTKIDNGIFSSTLWWSADPQAFRVFFYMLATINRAGIWEGTLPGIAGQCRLSIEQTEEIIAYLEAPEKYSRSQEHEGRRIQKVDGGWKVLNYWKYRLKDYSTERNREYDEKHPKRKHTSKKSNNINEATLGDGKAIPGDSESASESASERGEIPPPPCSEFSDEPLPSPSGYRETKQLQAKLATEALEANHVAAPDIAQVVERLNAAQKKYFDVPGSLDAVDPKIRRAALKGLEWCKNINPIDPGKILAQSWLTCIEECDKSKKKPVFEWFIKDISNYYREFKKQAAGN